MKARIRVGAILLTGLLAQPVLAEATAATAPNRFVEVGGNRIAYRAIGSGPPMIVLTRMRGTLDATHAALIGTAPPGTGVAIQAAFLERAFKPVNDLDDEIVLFFEPASAAAAYHDDASGRRAKLKGTRTPILVISGDNDISTAVENWFALNREIPDAHLIVYPETGHGPQHQYPELAAAHIALFQKLALPE